MESLCSIYPKSAGTDACFRKRCVCGGGGGVRATFFPFNEVLGSPIEVGGKCCDPPPPPRLAPLDPPLRCIHILVLSLMIISPLNSQPSSPHTLPGHPALTLFPELTRQKVEKAVSNKSLCHQQLATRESPQHVARSHLPPGLGSAPPASSQVCFGGFEACSEMRMLIVQRTGNRGGPSLGSWG